MDNEENQRDAEMAEGYQALAKENKEFAEMVLEIALEVIPVWE